MQILMQKEVFYDPIGYLGNKFLGQTCCGVGHFRRSFGGVWAEL